MTFLGFTPTALELICALAVFIGLAVAIALFLYWDWRDEQDDVAI